MLRKRMDKLNDERVVKLLILDAMVPGQRLSVKLGAPLSKLLHQYAPSSVEGLREGQFLKKIAARAAHVLNAADSSDARTPCIEMSSTSRPLPHMLFPLPPGELVMMGVDSQRRQMLTHGVSCHIESWLPGPDGTVSAVIAAGETCQLISLVSDEAESGAAEGVDRLVEARVRLIDLRRPAVLPPEEQPTAELKSLASSLGELVDQWTDLVRCTGRERSEGQLVKVVDDLGPMPPPELPSALAFWIAGLINPLPALGVALEVRPAALMAGDASERLRVVEAGLKDSISRLQKRPGPLF